MFAQGVRHVSGCVMVIMLLASANRALALDQWANSVIDFSTQYGTTDWSASRALGSPDTNTYEDNETAWAPESRDGNTEFISVAFQTAVYATGVVVRETWGNGFVTQIDLIDTDDGEHIIWSETDTSMPGAPVNFTIEFAKTAYLVKGVKVTTDTNHNLETWEEIDAIQLRGTAPAGTACGAGVATLVLVPFAMPLMRAYRRR